MKGIKSFDLDQVLLTNDYYRNAFMKEIDYLLAFDINMLLAGFRDTAGLDKKGAARYSGWESTLIGGHTLGHYLTACVQAYQSANSTDYQKKQILSMISELIEGLKECQDKVGTGFVFGALILDPENIELQFDHVEKNNSNIFTQAWVPWYTMHKIFEGLLMTAQLADEFTKSVAEKALVIVSRLGDWVCNRVDQWSDSIRTIVLSIEYGGMNDCLYELFCLTKDSRYAKAAHAFDQVELFEKVLKGKTGDHILNNYHANTTIPKFLGALNRYLAYSGENTVDAGVYLDYAKAFWEMVVSNHTYITGGNSEWEHFGLDDVLDAERTNANNETCNAYNMLKLTKKLFLLTGDVKYADYYENTFLNSILSSQNPETGMTTYFQPMATGYFKVFGERFDKFWCCTGSGMENFTKLGESFYYNKEDVLFVNQYVSSELSWVDKKVKLIQETKLPVTDTSLFTIKTLEEGDRNIAIAFRLPDWLAAEAHIDVNGLDYTYVAEEGYAFVQGPFADGTEITIKLPMDIRAFSLADSESIYGFKYGPVVLSALLGTKNMEMSTTGIIVTIPQDKLVETSYVSSGDETIRVKSDTVHEFMENINDYMKRDYSDNQIIFKLYNTDANLIFVPHYSQYTQRYGIYWRFISSQISMDQPMSTAEEEAKKKAFRLDTVQPGYGQYENDELHNMQEYGNGSTGDTSVGTSRFANANGSFSYRMIVDTVNGTNLLITCKAEDNGKTIRIKVGNNVIYDQVLNAKATLNEYDVLISLPIDVLSSNALEVNMNGKIIPTVVVTFEGAKGEASSRICNFLYTIKVN